jgi:mRNA interferase MazF
MPVQRAKRGEVWKADLGLIAKTRPVLILGTPGPNHRQIFTYVPHTTQLQGTEFEVSIPARYLEKGAFDAQGISTVQTVKLLKKLGDITPDQLREVENAILQWLEID